jgi:hypothetical protein
MNASYFSDIAPFMAALERNAPPPAFKALEESTPFVETAALEFDLNHSFC